MRWFSFLWPLLILFLCEWKSVCLRAWDAPEKVRAVIDDIAYTATTTLEGKKSNDRRDIKGAITRDARRASRQPFPAQVATAAAPTTQVLHQVQIAAAQPPTVPVNLHTQHPDAVAAAPVDGQSHAPSMTVAATSRSRKRHSSAATSSESVEALALASLQVSKPTQLLIESCSVTAIRSSLAVIVLRMCQVLKVLMSRPLSRKQKFTHVSAGADTVEFDDDDNDFSLDFGFPPS